MTSRPVFPHTSLHFSLLVPIHSPELILYFPRELGFILRTQHKLTPQCTACERAKNIKPFVYIELFLDMCEQERKIQVTS